MRFDWEYFGQYPELTAEVALRNEAIEAFAKRNNTSPEEERRHLAEIGRSPGPNGMTRFELGGYSYDEERDNFRDLCEKLYQKNQERFSSAEEVFKFFAQAAMTGKLLPVARLIEATYGKGSFRSVGEKSGRYGNRDVL
jgi:hypothetical protein